MNGLEEYLNEAYAKAHALRELLLEENCRSLVELAKKMDRGEAQPPAPYLPAPVKSSVYNSMVTGGFDPFLTNKCITEGWGGYNLKNVPEGKETISELRRSLEAWYKTYPRQMKTIVIYGDTGRGKTHLATLIASRIIKEYSGLKARYIRDRAYRDSELQFQKQPTPDKFSPADNLRYSPPDVLVLDEFGDRPTGWGFGFWLDMLDAMQTKPVLLIVCSNLRPGSDEDKMRGTMASTESNMADGTGAAPVSSRLGSKANIILALAGDDWRAG